jgi:hypothetical protein
MTNPALGTSCVTQMKNIKPGAKLDPKMFQVPPDFKIAPPPVKPPPLKPPALKPPALKLPSLKPPALKPPKLSMPK